MPSNPDLVFKADLDRVIDAAVENGFAGQVAIVRDGAYVYRRHAGFADRSSSVAVSSNTKFHVASIAKYFTAALALRAVEEGKLDLFASISPLVEGTALADRDITFLDLLAHRSGLGSSYAAEKQYDQSDALAAIDAAGVDEAEAGTFRYSNDGYDLMAILLERIYGQPYEQLSRTRLLAPACLGQTAFWGETDLTDPNLVSQPLRGVARALRRRNYGMIGSAGLLTTADDLVAWQTALKAGRILSSVSYEALTAPRGSMSLGEASFGGFIVHHPTLGKILSVRGTEDWGDNAYLNDYIDCGVTVAIVTSRGPSERLGRPLFRDQILDEFESALARRCST